MVKVVVQQRKLTRGLVANFPDPSARARVADKGVSKKCGRFRAFLGVQNRTKLDKIVQKPAKSAQKLAENGTFSRPILLKCVKSRGWCQAVTEAVADARHSLLGGGGRRNVEITALVSQARISVRVGCWASQRQGGRNEGRSHYIDENKGGEKQLFGRSHYVYQNKLVITG